MNIIINDEKIEIMNANTFYKNLKGLCFKKNINYCLKLKCSSIHTFFMREKIDVIQTDKNNIVIRYYKNLEKNKVILPKKNIYYTYELPYNTINTLNIGSKLDIK